ncbi:MAG: sensor histidine kinase [Ornithinimicrobium sp.]|uniref:sensor histidine kinase n=1 Tax=Ornithinimicrobium sp. TaxID=1977084 RepID=UPI003D9B7625
MTIITARPRVISDQQRDDQIERYDVLGQPPGRDLQALVDLAAQVCGVPIAIINLLTSDHAHAIAASGVDPFVCTRGDSMCTPVLDNPDIVLVADARADERYVDNPMVNGEQADVRFYASVPLRSDAGGIIGRLCVFDRAPRTLEDRQRAALHTLAARVMDVLDLRLRNRQLEQSLTDLTQTRDELRRSNDQLALFAGQVSHDLRTPLTAVIVNVESLLQEPAVAADTELVPLALSALRASTRMAGLIDDLLEHATVGAKLRMGDADLTRIAEATLEDLGPALRDGGAEVCVGDLPVVWADPVQLYSVMLNLLSNAVKFARPGVPARITVRGQTLPDRWCVQITDNGIGIPSQRHDEIFGMHTRLEESVTGHGIGLPIARRIVEAHGGRIGVSAELQVGAEVWFELPR